MKLSNLAMRPPQLSVSGLRSLSAALLLLSCSLLLSGALADTALAAGTLLPGQGKGPGLTTQVELRTGTAPNKCIIIPGNVQSVGIPLQQYDCNAATTHDAQTFILFPIGEDSYWYNILSLTRPDLCLGWASLSKDGQPIGPQEAPVELQNCDDGDNQAFGFFDVSGATSTLRPRHATSYCLDIKNGWSDNKMPLQLYTCNSARNKQFTWTTELSALRAAGPGLLFELRTGTAPNKCIIIPENAQSEGTSLQQYDCTPAATTADAQTFSLVPAGNCDKWYNIKSSKGLCLGFSLETKAGQKIGPQGAPVELQKCNDGDNQAFGFFDVSGATSTLRPRHATSYCLDIKNGWSDNKMPLQLYTCNSARNKQFTWVQHSVPT